MRIPHPCLQPLRLRLRSNLGKFRTNIAADQISCRILYGMAGGTERFAVKAGGFRLQVGVVFHFLCRVERGLHDSQRGRRALRNQECGDIARIIVAQLEVRHGCRRGIRLRILQPCEDPLARSLVRDVRQGWRIVGPGDHGAIRPLDGVAMNAAVGAQHLAAEIQLRRALQVLLVALPARRFQIFCRQQRLLPCQRTLVRIFN